MPESVLKAFVDFPLALYLGHALQLAVDMPSFGLVVGQRLVGDRLLVKELSPSDCFSAELRRILEDRTEIVIFVVCHTIFRYRTIEYTDPGIALI